MATINEANLLEDLVLFIKRLQTECPANSTSHPYLTQIIQKLSQPTYYIENNNEGRGQINDYLGLLFTELMLQDQRLFNNKTRLHIQAFEQALAPRPGRQPQRNY